METHNFIALQASDDSVGEKQNGDSFNNVAIEADSRQGCSNEGEMVNNEVTGHKSGVQLKELDGPVEENPEKNMTGYDSDMEIEDLNEAPLMSETISVSANNGICDLNCEPGQADFHSRLTGDPDTGIKSVNLVESKDNAPYTDGHCVTKPNVDENSNDDSLVFEVNAKLTETVAVASTLKSTTSSQNTRSNTVSGVKRTRTMFDEQNPSICVKYNSLTRSSKCKLEELLQQWSEWHAKHALSAQDTDEALESGEETFFPALHIGLDKASVSFWMDQQPRKQNSEFVPLDDKSVPMYDRGYALGLISDEGTSNVERGLEIVDDAARCFNCGSYNHGLKDCTKPRDNAAVNSARKQLKSKRNQNSRNQTRYYQNSPAGKYDGLRPGALDPETRKLLGLGEFDPPPWLNRMRELGYPPGYLDPDEEDQPSGITIFADGEIKEEQEDGEIVDTVPIEMPKPEPKMKMTVEFPGINGPIPKNADERLWVDVSVNRLYRQNSANHSLEHVTRAHHREERWPRLERRDDGPPGVDQGFNPALSTQLPRYSTNRYESGYHSHSPRLDFHGRSEPERGRSRYLDEGSYGSSPYFTHRSPTDNGPLRHGNWVDSRNAYDLDYSSYGGRDRQERYRHLSRR